VAPAQQGGGGGHGGPARLASCPASPTGCVTGKTAERKEIRSDRLGPHGSERRRKVGNSWAGCLCWAARIGGLAVCAGLWCKVEGVLQTSTDVVKAQSGRDDFPII
jgi:hypothetical protein